MKVPVVLALATAGSAFVVPDEQVNHLKHVQKESRRSFEGIFNRLPTKSQVLNDLEESLNYARQGVEETYNHINEDVSSKYDLYASQSKETLTNALEYAQDAEAELTHKTLDTFDDAREWVESTKEAIHEAEDYSSLGHHGHHGHHEPNMTVYQLIAESKYTTKLAKLISKYDDLVEALNGTSANFTVFAPTDYAFSKIPEDAPKPSKEFLKALLSYHVSPDFYPAGRILVTRTIPTLLKSPSLGKKPLPQRLSTNIGFKGLTVNYYSRVVAANIFGTNGVVHGVDSIILPPPRILKIIDLLPTEFSTLELGLGKTGLFDKLNTTDHAGGTFFAPSNFAFQKLGAKVNAFLFSEYGLKYLKAILEYHVVPKNTLYSDAYYKAESSESAEGVPKGVFHVDLPTMLEDRSLGVDIARYGRLIEIKINGFSRVTTPDAVAYDGVLHVVDNVLIPPKKLASGELLQWNRESELTEEDLIERLEPYVQETLLWGDL